MLVLNFRPFFVDIITAFSTIKFHIVGETFGEKSETMFQQITTWSTWEKGGNFW
jgi:hypothetical protein